LNKSNICNKCNFSLEKHYIKRSNVKYLPGVPDLICPDKDKNKKPIYPFRILGSQ